MNRAWRRIIQGLAVLWGAWTLVFFLFAWVPDPARQMAGQNERQEVVDAFRARHGLDQPLSVRYFRFWAGLLPVGRDAAGEWGWKSPDLGRSFIGDRSVAEALGGALPATLFLACWAMGIASVLGILLGLFLSTRVDTPLDRWLLAAAALGMSAPSFVVAIGLAWLLGSVAHAYTGLPMTGGMWEVDPFEGPGLAWRNAILPILTLAVRPLSVVTQLTRNAALEVREQPYIRTARGKGLSERRILFRHVLRNALNPVVTAISGWFATLLAGAVFVEFVFGWQGMGMLMFRALEQGDLPMVMGCVGVVAALFVVVNFGVDLLHGWLDPRMSD
jgi:peptide/nickel transport system permease protein